MSSSNWKDSRLKRAEETGSRSTYSWPPPRRTLSFISRLSLFPAYKVNSRRHTLAYPLSLSKSKENPLQRPFSNPPPWAGVRPPIVLSNFLFHFFLLLLFLRFRQNSKKIVRIKTVPINPRVASSGVAQCRSRFVEERLVSSRGIYITRGYWRAFLTRRQNIDTTTSARYCCSPCPPVTSTISTGNRRYLRNVARKR